MPLTEGQVFAGYTIVRVLGAGGMGEVYLAAHPRLPRNDALKVLGPAVSDDAEYRQRFNQEAEMVAGCTTPTSSRSTTAANSMGDCGSRWSSSTAPTRTV